MDSNLALINELQSIILDNFICNITNNFICNIVGNIVWKISDTVQNETTLISLLRIFNVPRAVSKYWKRKIESLNIWKEFMCAENWTVRRVLGVGDESPLERQTIYFFNIIEKVTKKKRIGLPVGTPVILPASMNQSKQNICVLI